MLTQSIQTLGAAPFATILQDDHGTINCTRVDESVRFGPMRIDRYHSICHRPIHPHHDLSGDSRAYRIRPRRTLLEDIFSKKVAKLAVWSQEPMWVQLHTAFEFQTDSISYQSNGITRTIPIWFFADREETLTSGGWLSPNGFDAKFPDSLLRQLQVIYFTSSTSREAGCKHDLGGEADSQEGRINLFHVDKILISDLRRIFWHEIGHLFLNSFKHDSTERERIWQRLLRPLWILAMRLDCFRLQRDYHRYSLEEHFAEALAEYMEDTESFKGNHPHRAAVIELGINNVFEEVAKTMEAGFPTTLGGMSVFYKLLTHNPFF